MSDLLSQEEFFEGFSVPRNQEMMRIFKDLEFVEHLGSGVPRILETYPRECFHFTDNFIRMTFPNAWNLSEDERDAILKTNDPGTPHDTPHDGKNLSEQIQNCINTFSGEMTRIELQQNLGLKDRKYFRAKYLLPSIEIGFVEAVGTYIPKNKNQKYRLTELGKAIQIQLKRTTKP